MWGDEGVLSRRLSVLSRRQFVLCRRIISAFQIGFLGLFLLQFLRISKLLYLFSSRESTALRAALRGGRNPGSRPLLTISPLSLCKYQINILKNGYLFGTCKLPSADFLCTAEQVPMQCSSPMQFITTYVSVNYCRSISVPFIITYVSFNCCRSISILFISNLCGFYTNHFLKCGYYVSLKRDWD